MASGVLPAIGMLWALVVFVVAFVLFPFGFMHVGDPGRLGAAWVCTLLLGAAVWWAIGRLTARGSLFLDERGRWSLSRFQLIAWSVLVVPTIWVMLIARLAADGPDPLALAIPDDVWWLLGISGASTVGSSLIVARKAQTPGVLADGKSAAGGPLDLVRGEDAGNADIVDIGRIQMLFFTGVTLLVYGAACYRAFGATKPAELAFPAMSSSLVALLAISHATYLANKTIDRKEVKA